MDVSPQHGLALLLILCLGGSSAFINGNKAIKLQRDLESSNEAGSYKCRMCQRCPTTDRTIWMLVCCSETASVTACDRCMRAQSDSETNIPEVLRSGHAHIPLLGLALIDSNFTYRREKNGLNKNFDNQHSFNPSNIHKSSREALEESKSDPFYQVHKKWYSPYKYILSLFPQRLGYGHSVFLQGMMAQKSKSNNIGEKMTLAWMKRSGSNEEKDEMRTDFEANPKNSENSEPNKSLEHFAAEEQGYDNNYFSRLPTKGRKFTKSSHNVDKRNSTKRTYVAGISLNVLQLADLHQTPTEPVSASRIKSVSASRTEPVSVSRTEPVSAYRTEPASASRTDHVSVSRTEPVSASRTKSVSASRTEPVSASRTKPVAASRTEPVSTSSIKPVSASRTEPVSASRTKPVSASKTESVSASKTEPVSASRTEPVSASRTEPVSASRTEPVSTVRTEPVSVSRTEPVSVSRTESVSASRTEPVSASRTEPVSVSRTEPASAPRIEPASAPRTDPALASRTEPVSAYRTEPASASRTDHVSVSRTEPVSAYRTKSISASRTEPASVSRTEPVSASRTKPASAPRTKPASAPRTKPASASRKRTKREQDLIYSPHLVAGDDSVAELPLNEIVAKAYNISTLLHAADSGDDHPSDYFVSKFLLFVETLKQTAREFYQNSHNRKSNKQ